MVNVAIRFTVTFKPEDHSTVSEILKRFNVATTLINPVRVVKFADRESYRASRECRCDLDRFENLIQYLDNNCAPRVTITVG